MHFKTLLLTACAGLASLGSTAHAEIYTCVDSKGRTITADRPISDCLDRHQRELSQSGLTKRQVGPSLTAHEEVLQEKKDRQVVDQRNREVDAKRRDRTLLMRYSNRAVHDQERAALLAPINEAIRLAKNTIAELLQERKAITNELAQYAKNPSLAPEALTLNLQDNKDSMQEYQRAVVEQEQEKKLVNQRFDDELARLKQLWTDKAN